MSRSLLRRITPLVHSRIQWNQKLLSSAVEEVPSESPDAIRMTENCIRRLKQLHAKESSAQGKMLRLSVETGGCSGFQYVFLLDDKKNADDRLFEKDGVKLVVDNISYDFVKGATIDYVEELIRSAFLVVTNPNAVGGCSCKSSFMVN
ncbi:iron-sulfur assembly protein IscA-like 2, mitochondrial [Elaeis guineensis]|uniref:Iron-sulfur assembly protein IscA-like 2, mitochondrial n=1 Tax=Elaeis guineensis var. tenera TaxID=51953 RepID=A0A6I9S6U5_ELAGV|nr:iron-sulfur assembly protein IscA-like 2, mitochondrial [Elaeis guineensis]